MPEDPKRRKQEHKRALDHKRSNFESRPSLLARRKHLKVPKEENKHLNCALNAKG